MTSDLTRNSVILLLTAAGVWCWWRATGDLLTLALGWFLLAIVYAILTGPRRWL